MARNANIQVRRDTAANWTSVNPVLNAGEFGFETNTGKVKIGDGTTAWTSLTYVTDGSKLTGTIAASTATTLATARNINGVSFNGSADITVTATPTDGTVTDAKIATTLSPSKVTGTAVTQADTGTVTSTMILDGTILNADINTSAAIAATKISGTAAVLASANAFTVGGHTITNATDVVSLVLKGSSAPQTADLQQWQNSGATPLSRITSAGAFVSAVGGHTITNSTDVKALVLTGVSGQTANMQEWVNTNGAANSAYMGASGRFSLRTTSANAVLNVFTTGTIGASIQGAGTQTSDLMQFLNVGGTILGGRNGNAQIFTGSTAPITSQVGGAPTGSSYTGTTNGTFTLTLTSAPNLAVGDLVTVSGLTFTGTTPNGTFVLTAVSNTATFSISYTLAATPGTVGNYAASTVVSPAQVSITARSAGTKGLVVKTASGNQVNIQEWQDATGTLLASIGTNGAVQTGFIANTNGSTNIILGTNRNTQIGNTSSFGGGQLVLGITNAIAVPTSNPTGGGVLYVTGGALAYLGTSGTSTTLASASGGIPASSVTGTAVTVGPTSMQIANVRAGDWLQFSYGASTPAAARIQAREHCQWVRFPYAVTLDRLSILVQTAGSTGAVVRLGIRNDDNGRPGTVLLDAGTASATTSSSYPTITINQTLQANTSYWLSATAQGTPTTGAITRIPSTLWLPGIVGNSGQSVASAFGYYQDSVTGALPSTFTSAGELTINNADGYCWALRVA